MTAAYAAALAAAFGSISTWLIARRAKSGRIETTEAQVLWAEAGAMRREMREELLKVRLDHAQCQERLGRLEARLGIEGEMR